MLVKQPSILLAHYSGFLTLPSGSSTSPRRWRPNARPHRRARDHHRTYATIVGDAGEGNGAHEQPEHTWPKPTGTQTCPTPYQIFAMRHNAEYSKARFYALVKLYHPDLKCPGTSNVSHQVKTERYRLIVAAHTILSDPVKRSAYDRHGAGWNGKAEVVSHQGSGSHAPGPFSHSWNNQSDPIWQNATWEDWERFHARRAREQNPDKPHQEPQSPLYLQNSYFLGLVVLLAFMGGSANYNRAQDAGTYFVEQRDLVHDRAAKELRKVRQEMSGMKGRDERIQWFLRQREAAMGQAAMTDVEALREEKASRLLPETEVCRSEAISEKNS